MSILVHITALDLKAKLITVLAVEDLYYGRHYLRKIPLKSLKDWKKIYKHPWKDQIFSLEENGNLVPIPATYLMSKRAWNRLINNAMDEIADVLKDM